MAGTLEERSDDPPARPSKVAVLLLLAVPGGLLLIALYLWLVRFKPWRRFGT